MTDEPFFVTAKTIQDNTAVIKAIPEGVIMIDEPSIVTAKTIQDNTVAATTMTMENCMEVNQNKSEYPMTKHEIAYSKWVMKYIIVVNTVYLAAIVNLCWLLGNLWPLFLAVILYIADNGKGKDCKYTEQELEYKKYIHIYRFVTRVICVGSITVLCWLFNTAWPIVLIVPFLFERSTKVKHE